MSYSSPQAYLNRFFRKSKKFKLEVGQDYMAYSNDDFMLQWLEGETFILCERIREYDTGADYFEDHSQGNLVELVEAIRNFYKTGVLK